MAKKRCRSGCITCRIRRIKCDEAKPSCLRCTSTGRKCDGYMGDQHNATDRKLKLDVHASRSMIALAPRSGLIEFELRALQYFQTRTAPALSASFDCNFWSTILLQVSATQSPVRSAIVALSSFHESFEKSQGTLGRTGHSESSHARALQQYNRAVRETAQMLAVQDAKSCRLALMSCLLFTCLELIQDNYTFSINHLMGGLNLLIYCQSRAPSMSPSSELSFLHDNLKRFFGRLIVQTMFLADTHFDIVVIPKYGKEDMQDSFSSVSEARDMLDTIFLSVYPFLYLAKTESNQSMGKVYQKVLTNRHQEWYRRFREFEASNHANFCVKDITGIRLLEIHYRCLCIMVDTSLDKSQCFLESPAPPFMHIITLVENVLAQQTDLTSILPHYSFDLGVIGPLFFTAMKCWNSGLRKKVVSLLQHPQIPHREGIWNAAMTVLMTQQIIQVEEEIVEMEYKGQPKTIRENIWFDFVKPREDKKQLKIIAGAERKKPKERREAIISW